MAKSWISSPDGKIRREVENEALDYFLDAGWLVHKDARITHKDAAGQTFDIKGADYAKVRNSGRMTRETGEEEQLRQHRDAFKGQETAALIDNLAHGFTGGISTLGAYLDTDPRKVRGEWKKRDFGAYMDRKDSVPGAAGAEIAGMGVGVLGSFLTGPAGLIGKATLPGMAARAGVAAEGLVGKGLSAATRKTLAGKIASKATAIGVGGGIDSAIMGTTDLIIDSTVREKDLTGEQILMRAGKSFALGFGLSAGATGVGMLGVAATKRAAKFTGKVLEDVGLPGIKQMADDAAVATLDPGLAVRKAWRENHIDVERVLRDRKIGINLNKGANLEAAQTARKQIESQIDNTIDYYERITAGIDKPHYEQTLEKIKPGLNKKQAKAVDLELARLNDPRSKVDVPGPGGGDLKLNLDPTVNRSFRTILEAADSFEAAGHAEVAQKLRREVSERLRAGRASKEGIADMFGAINDLRVVKQAEKAAEDVLAKAPKNSSEGMLPFGIGALFGGAGLGALPALVAAGIGRKLAATHGPQVVAALLDRVSRTRGFSGLADDAAAAFAKTSKALSTDAFKAVPRSILNKLVRETVLDPAGEKGKKDETKVEAFKRISEQAANAVRDPNGFSKRIQERLAVLSDIDPEMGASAEAVYHRAAIFLNEKAPKNPAASRTINPAVRDWKPSDTELSKYMRYVAAVENPQWVLEEFLAGRPFREGSEAMEAVWPKVYEDMQLQVMKGITEMDKQLPYDRRRALSIMLKIPVESTMRGPFILSQMARWSGQPEQPPAQNAPPQRVHRNAPDAQKQVFKGASKLAENNPSGTAGDKLAARV